MPSAVAALRSHEAPDEVRLTAIRPAFLRKRRTLDAELIIRPVAVSGIAA
jgi:hypothetical protein